MWFSVFDILIVGLLGFAGWRGYNRGAFVESFSFATIIVGIYLASRFSDGTANLLSDRANGKDFSYLPVIMFMVLFGGLIYLSIMVNSSVSPRLGEVERTKPVRVMGAILGVLHMFLILGVAAVMLKAADYNFRVIPDHEKEDSFLFDPLRIAMVGLFPSLDYVGEVDEDRVNKELEDKDQTKKVIDK